MENEKIAILDCGGQYTKVIDRKIRELCVKSDIFPISVKAEQLQAYNGIILSGGPASVWAADRPDYDPDIFQLKIPMLGICYGLHLINTHFGGEVKPGIKTEYGETNILIDTGCLLFQDLNQQQQVLMSHGDSILKIAPDFEKCAHSGIITAAIASPAKKMYAVQFHPEVDLTTNGKKILSNFLKKICDLICDYTLEDRVTNSIRMIQQKVGKHDILVLVSGGVDSAVSAALLLKALEPDKILAIHVDHGFMRKNESDLICENLKELGLKKIMRLNVADDFLNTSFKIDGKIHPPLCEVTEPEEKRNIIGHAFIEVIKTALEESHLDFDTTFIAQGTLRPDLIESGNPDISSYAHKIKTHHNDVSIIRRAREKGLVIETNWDWHKDEVRQVAKSLGINKLIAQRQPFPGPGLAIRMICADKTRILPREQHAQFNVFFNKLESEYSGEVVPINTVGVQGDCRSYRYLTILSGKGMELEWTSLYTLGTTIPNQLNFINRVAYVLNKPIVKNIQNYPLKISKANMDLLREIDFLVRQSLESDKMSQVFAVLLPVGVEKKLSVAIRTFITNDFMTGRPAIIPQDVAKETLSELVQKIAHDFSEIDLILYDVTSKPPATVEWE